jgi:hypothetical protein
MIWTVCMAPLRTTTSFPLATLWWICIRFINVDPKSFLWISLGYAEPFLTPPLYRASHKATSRIILALSAGLTRFSFSIYLHSEEKVKIVEMWEIYKIHTSHRTYRLL